MKKALLIDDSPFMTQMFSLRLHDEGFDTLIAGNGEDGIKMAKTEVPNVILLDLAMPQMTGWEVLKRLKDSDTTKDIPVIILTNSKGNKEDIERAKKAGAAEFLMKIEYNIDEIIKVVNKYA
ncbi:MAG: response regulator [Patescibacteria group bacterium]|nr:response regulator [Patescibacteria group bacterium]